DHIVVDTAPFGHTLRLFELPGHFQRFLNFLEVASSRDDLLAQRFGGRTSSPAHGFLEKWQATVKKVKEAFSVDQAEVLLVTSPETFSLNEAVRCVDALRESAAEMRLGGIVLNRVVVSAESCARCRARTLQGKKAVQFLKQKFPRVPRLIGIDPGNPLLGAKQLQRFGDLVFAGERANLAAPPRAAKRKLKFAKTKWPAAETRLSFTLGKGGVGKTTVTAALAFHSRSLNKDVHVTVCSTDPAPSLDDVFQKKIGDQMVSVLGDPGLGAMEMDAIFEFRGWAARIKKQLSSGTSMESGGLHVDLTFEKEVFAALMDVVPPGVDEVFAIFRILDLLEARRGSVFIDMAPTGHALELLRMPERILLWSRLLLKSLAAHRTLALAQDVAVELAGLGQRVRRLLEMMRDPKQSRAWAVMLPEPVPDRQTQRLLAAMKELGIAVDSLFVNRVLLGPSGCQRCQRAQKWQLATLQSLQKKYGDHRLYLVRDFPAEIAGAAKLKKFTGELWQIQTEK
ncbi:MAG TPA: TRC40/GET3/ArsA family transport-energizing ATPase, partial [Candidatus Acidoferrum sp.]|nr:TRC40/GET3/ArsA family transport-energizing ATPase [Candidatus Acidoferrum sp.]